MNCRPPQHYPWTDRFLDAGYQLFYLDQRGTGLSTPVTASTLQMRGYNDVQAKYLKLYRADNIVRDAEAIRQALTADYPEEKKKWSIMGQSFGGFCRYDISMNFSIFMDVLADNFPASHIYPSTHKASANPSFSVVFNHS